MGGDVVEVLVEARKNSSVYFENDLHQPVHNDNAYTDFSPKYVALYCLKRALQGGESLIVEAQTIFSYVKNIFGDRAIELFASDAIQFIHKGLSVRKPLFYHFDVNQIGICFTPFAQAIVGKTKFHEEAFIKIVEIANDPVNQKVLLLEEGDMLVIDNRKVLHGRTGFHGERRLMRYWFDYIQYDISGVLNE